MRCIGFLGVNKRAFGAEISTTIKPLAQIAINFYIASMNSKHQKTLSLVFDNPVSGNIAWARIERLLLAAGAETIEGSGSRVRFVKGNEIETFHRPHPVKEAKRYQVRAARDFLIRIGVTP